MVRPGNDSGSEGARTDSLYLFNWTFLGQPIPRWQVSQALSLLLAGTAAVMLFYNIKIKKALRDELLVNQVAAGPPRGLRRMFPRRKRERVSLPDGRKPNSPSRRRPKTGKGERLMATCIDGKALATKVKGTRRQVAKSLYRRPGLAVILVGE